MKPVLAIICAVAALITGVAIAQQPIVTDCTPPAAELKVIAKRLRAEYSDDRAFLEALDKAVGVDTAEISRSPFLIVHQTKALTIFAGSPYAAFRDAIRRREAPDAIAVPPGFFVSVSPSQVDSPDIMKIVVERDGKEVEPVVNLLQVETFRTSGGGEKRLHAGELVYNCSAFAPGATITVTAIPETGSNIVATFVDKNRSSRALVGRTTDSLKADFGEPAEMSGARWTYITTDSKQIYVYVNDGRVTDVSPADVPLESIAIRK
jgi:hypothetical protein